MFFADLGDPYALSFDEQQAVEKKIAENKRIMELNEKERIRLEKEERKKRKEERRKKREEGIDFGEGSKEGSEIFSETENNASGSSKSEDSEN